MGITTWGWGSCGTAIGSFGWGACPCSEYIPSIIADFLADSKAYSCIITRKCVQIKKRTSDEVLLRVKPSAIPSRIMSELLLRSDKCDVVG